MNKKIFLYLDLLKENNTDLEYDLDRIINIEYDKNYKSIQ
jgi:hypothetical protein